MHFLELNLVIKLLKKNGDSDMSRYIKKSVESRLYAESMGLCMNPNCKKVLFSANGDIMEKAHIDPYCKSADNTFENLVVLCANCHTDFDKNNAFSPEEVLNWKRIRQNELQQFFSIKYSTFEDLKKAACPLLLENKRIYQNYYLKNHKLWDKFEPILLSNNNKLKTIFKNNRNLFQCNSNKEHSNLHYIDLFIMHADEFELTRNDEEKERTVLFPEEINSMFGIEPQLKELLPLTESIECLISQLIKQNILTKVNIGCDNPYLELNKNGDLEKLYLNDIPNLRQYFNDYKCFRYCRVRFESLNFALKYLSNKNKKYQFLEKDNLRHIIINNQKYIFVYEYCLSKAFLIDLMPEEKTIIVNLHNWNGKNCISKEAYEQAHTLNVILFTMDDFYRYV